MKLIKINNGENTGYFTNQFSQIIDFEAESQVALVSSVFSIGLNNIVIDATNNTLEFKRKAGNGANGEAFIPVALLINNYSTTSFLQMMRTQINSAQTVLTSGADFNGFDINPAVNDNGLFTISFEKTKFQDVNSGATSFPSNMTYTALSTEWKATANDTPNFTYDSWVFGNPLFQNGCGIAKCTFDDNTGFIGLFKEQPTQGSRVVETDIVIGLIIHNDLFYRVINGVKTELAGAVTYPVDISLKLENGYVTFYENADPAGIFQVEYDYNTPAFYIGAGLQNKDSTISAFGYTVASFTTTNTTEDYVEYNDKQLITKVSSGSGTTALNASIFIMNLNQKLSEILGYTITNLTFRALSHTFTAVYNFVDSIINESIDVQLINVGNVNSYDSTSKGIQKIIGVIPLGSNLIGSKIAYSAPELIYVDLNNKFDVPVSNLTFRIVGSESGTQLVFEKGITLVLAVRSRKELMYK